jgi:hypothetical protein
VGAGAEKITSLSVEFPIDVCALGIDDRPAGCPEETGATKRNVRRWSVFPTRPGVNEATLIVLILGFRYSQPTHIDPR